MDYLSLKSRQGIFLITATTIVSGLSFLEGSAVNIAVPTIQESLDIGVNYIQWILNSYILVMATLILVTGSLSDIFGYKKIFLSGILIFTVTSILSALAPSALWLIFFRAFQGVGAALMIPGSLALINIHFDKKDRGKAIGVWSGVSGGIAALGPLLGGWLTENLGWEAVFWAFAPIGLLTLILAYYGVPKDRIHKPRKIDFIGIVLFLAGMFLLSFALIEGPTRGLTNQLILTTFVFGLIILAAFIYSQFKIKEPLLDLNIFKKKIIWGANLITLFLYFALNGILFLLAINFQQVQGFSPTVAGLAFLPTILLISFLSGPSGIITDKYGMKIPLALGTFLVGLGISLFGFAGVGVNYYYQFLPGLILFGFGMSLVIPAITKAALSVSDEYSGAASGVNNSVARISGLLAVAILGGIIVLGFSRNLQANLQSIDLSTSQIEMIADQTDKLLEINLPADLTPEQSKETTLRMKKTFVTSFKTTMWICAGLAFLCSGISIYTIEEEM